MKDRKRATSSRRQTSKSTARASNGGGRSPRKQSASGASAWRRFDKRWLVFIPALAIVWLSYSYARIAVTLPSPARVIEGAQGIDILDRDGDLIFAFGDEPGSGRVVPLDELSPHVIDATLAAEDAEFWDHPGVNVKGLARAAYENVAFWENGGLFKGSGGSSITQQLAKNLYIKPEERANRSPKRKLDEALIAFELTRRYSKEQILEWYLSNNYYGNGVYGIESASYRYLSKPPSELTLAEAAFLAGLPRSPGYYDPIGNYEAAVERQEQVLSLMVRHGFISEQEMDEALAQPVALKEGRGPNERTVADDLLAPHFAEYVREQLPVLLGQEKVQGHLTVTTTLDLDLQAMAVKAVKDQIAKLESQGVTNGALVAIDPATGEVRAMVGSYDFTRDDISGQVNNATALNQPGSTMKPVTYLTTFLKGWSPTTRITDEPITIGQGDAAFRLGNADGKYRGEVTVRTALGSSLNVPAVKALQYSGLETVYNLARRMGLSTLRELGNYGPSFTLGGADVSLLDMTFVYSVLANYGEQAGMPSVLGLPEGSRPLDPIAVLKIEDSDGDVLWEAEHRRVRITPADQTYLITDILSDDSARASMFGLNSPLNLPRPAAVKSGSSDETRDAWTIGYTPQLVSGVWVGNANNAPIPNGTSTYTAAPIWRAFMLAALQGQPALAFQKPGQEQPRAGQQQATPKSQEPVQGAGLKATKEPKDNKPTPKPKATETPRPTRTLRPPDPTSTPSSTPTPRPTRTPQTNDDD